MTTHRSGLLVLIGLGLAAALAILSMRWTVEASNRDVEVILDGLEWDALAVREGKDPDVVYAEARRRGATSVAVYEHTLVRLAEQGRVAYIPVGAIPDAGQRLRLPVERFRDLLGGQPVRAGRIYVSADAGVLAFVEDAFRAQLGAARVRRAGGLVEVAGVLKDVEETGLGYLPDDFDRYTRLGLRPVLRLRNAPGLSREGLRNKLERLAQLGQGYPVVFELTDVLGYERLVADTARLMRSAGYTYGRIEVFTARRRQRGEDRLVREMRPDVVRLFSLTSEELLVLTPASVRDKFVRAARERNIRQLYLRAFVPSAGVVGTDLNLALLSGIVRDLTRFGFRIAPARPLPEIPVPGWLWLMAAAGAVGVMVLAVAVVAEAAGAPLGARATWLLVVLGCAITAGGYAGGGLLLGRKLLALGAAGAAPVIAVALTVPRRAGGHPVGQGLRVLWTASLVSLAAGIIVAALLTEWAFMMAAEIFLGVKLAHLLPVIAVAAVLGFRERGVRHWQEAARELWGWSGRPLLVRYAIVTVVAGIAAVVLVARSGNFGLPLLSVEERLRDLTERLFVARPRTKEFLIGHPALLLAGAAAAAGWRMLVLPLAAVGTIGQAGIINSFSHLHTPLLYTLWRTGNALLLGSLLGAAAAAVLRWLAAVAGRRLPALLRRAGP